MNVHWNVVVAKVLSVESHTLNVEWGTSFCLTPLTSPPPTFSWASPHIEEDVLGWWEWVIRQIPLHRTSIHASSGESPNMNFWTQKCAYIYSEVWELVLTLCLKKQKNKKQKPWSHDSLLEAIVDDDCFLFLWTSPCLPLTDKSFPMLWAGIVVDNYHTPGFAPPPLPWIL